MRVVDLLFAYESLVDVLLAERREAADVVRSGSSLRMALRVYEGQLMTAALAQHRTISRAAKALGVERAWFYKRIEVLGVAYQKSAVRQASARAAAAKRYAVERV